jgi:hypothetical protein
MRVRCGRDCDGEGDRDGEKDCGLRRLERDVYMDTLGREMELEREMEMGKGWGDGERDGDEEGDGDEERTGRWGKRLR